MDAIRVVVERQNQKVLRYLKTFDSKADDWDTNLKFISFVINNNYNRNLGCSSFEAHHGWKPLTPSYLTKPDRDNKDLRDFDYSISCRIAKQRLAISSHYVNERDHKKQLETDHNVLTVGTKVLMRAERPVGESKLYQSWKGIFTIKKQLDNDSYLVTSEDDNRKEYIVYRNRLKVLQDSPHKPDRESIFGEEKGIVPLSERTSGKEAAVSDDSRGDQKYNLRNQKQKDYRKFY